jgi:uncharacterized protein (TIGR02996 family)
VAKLDELWAQVAETPEDLALRMVLGDALVDAGDPRGELIQLQCAGAEALGDHSSKIITGSDPQLHAAVLMRAGADEQAAELIATHWDAWLGPLAHLIDRRSSRFERGLLSTVSIGTADTPPEAWAAARGHRELCAIDRVDVMRGKPADYATFLAGLVRDPARIDVHVVGIASALLEHRPRWAFRHLRFAFRFVWRPGEQTQPPYAAEINGMARLCLDVELLTFAQIYGFDSAQAIRTMLPRIVGWFPKLRGVRFEDPVWIDGDLGPEEIRRLRA